MLPEESNIIAAACIFAVFGGWISLLFPVVNIVGKKDATSFASYCLRPNSMANEIIMFLCKAIATDFVLVNFVFNSIAAFVIEVEVQEQCELIDTFSKMDINLSLIAYFAFFGAYCQSSKGLI